MFKADRIALQDRGFAAAAWLCAAITPVLMGLVLFALAPGSARAQSAGAVLVSATSADLDSGDVQLTFTFASTASGFQLIKNDTDTPSIAFAAVRGPSLTLPPGGKGLLKSLQPEQADTILVLHMTTAGPVHMTATKIGDKVIVLTMGRKSHTQVAQQTMSGPSGPLPEHVERDPGQDGFEVVSLKYADVSEIVGLLTDGQSVKPNDSFTPHEPAFGSAGMGGAYQAPQPVTPETATDQPFAQSVDEAIGIDRRLNAIILRGSPERIARLKAKIAKLDVPVTSVVLETTFVELTESGAKNLGLDFNNANNQIAVASYQSGQYNTAQVGSSKGLASVSLQGAIYAQVQKGNGRIISRPRISAQSGGTAKIITGDALPILTSIALSGVNAVSQQVQYVNVGVTLQIAPRISDDGFVTSHVFCEVSSVTGTSQGYPTISQREASTSATVKDGEAFVIGGLTEENQLSTNSKLPIAGDVPIAGGLFHVNKSTLSKTQLYIVVTPHIVRGDGADAAFAADVLNKAN
ncbi:MAG TPA: secretin N-terminal domain-containing protein [Caulobacteraceae bacterium]